MSRFISVPHAADESESARSLVQFRCFLARPVYGVNGRSYQGAMNYAAGFIYSIPKIHEMSTALMSIK